MSIAHWRLVVGLIVGGYVLILWTLHVKTEAYAQGFSDARELDTPLPSQDVSRLDYWDGVGSSDPGAVYDQERDLLDVTNEACDRVTHVAVPLIVNVSPKRGNVFPIQRDGGDS